MSRPPPPPSATHSSIDCPNSSPAGISTVAADVDAVAAEAIKKKAEAGPTSTYYYYPSGHGKNGYDIPASSRKIIELN